MAEKSETRQRTHIPGQTLSVMERELSVLVRRLGSLLWSKNEEGALDRWTYALLMRLAEEGPLRGGEMARRFGIDKSTASRHLGRLEGQGLIRADPDPEDARSVLFQVTEQGAEHLAATRATRLHPLRRVVASWPERDRSELTRLLGQLNRELDQYGDT
ncbi:transcriptional regulator [Cystobacter fuscus]|uniref:Transcriptional regulator n=1 Tax=Cystobacter fuscus TaxID=43 RepID=A0A250JDR4_9BACT|nr:MarR family transcriptional regulator [Cystobacter fuscus]ATB41773.1 transcriptional regulator [Cystobacter fuscus]